MEREKQKRPAIKKRAAYLCNVKLLLLVLVVLGHSMEQVGMKGNLLYRLIYLFHMPLFAFVSGLHLKTVKSCLRQARTVLLFYLLIQGALTLAGRGKTLAVPYWHLWYLLSLFWWALLCGGCSVVLKKKAKRWEVILLVTSIAAALGCGLLPTGRELSLSRTVVFFPYVLLGMLCPVGLQDGPDRRTRQGLAAASLFGVLPICIVLREVPYAFLYHAEGYRNYHMGLAECMLLRLLCFAAGVSLGALVLALIPARRFPFTKFGGDTLPTYLLHVCFLPLLKVLCPEAGITALTVFSLTLVCLLWELFRWARPPYAIVQEQAVTFPLTKPRFPFIMKATTGQGALRGGDSHAGTHWNGGTQHEGDQNPPDSEPGRDGTKQHRY
ncbi:MAG: hypothetical protein LUD83_00195 [Clostridiales bacterium]|nr:hypothetical protein [Clostridiales bacterium]